MKRGVSKILWTYLKNTKIAIINPANQNLKIEKSTQDVALQLRITSFLYPSYPQMLFILFSGFFFKIIVLLRYNSQTIKFILEKCTV